MAVTYTVALTRVNMAASVIAMINVTVMMEARIFFIAKIEGLGRFKDSAGGGKNEWLRGGELRRKEI